MEEKETIPIFSEFMPTPCYKFKTSVLKGLLEIQWLVVPVPLVLVMPLDLLLVLMASLELELVFVKKVFGVPLVPSHVIVQTLSVIKDLMELVLVFVQVDFMDPTVMLVGVLLVKESVMMEQPELEPVCVFLVFMVPIVPSLELFLAVQMVLLILILMNPPLLILVFVSVLMVFLDPPAVEPATAGPMGYVTKEEMVLETVLVSLASLALVVQSLVQTVGSMVYAMPPGSVSVPLVSMELLAVELVTAHPSTQPTLFRSSPVTTEEQELETVFSFTIQDHPFNPSWLFLL